MIITLPANILDRANLAWNPRARPYKADPRCGELSGIIVRAMSTLYVGSALTCSLDQYHSGMHIAWMDHMINGEREAFWWRVSTHSPVAGLPST